MIRRILLMVALTLLSFWIGCAVGRVMQGETSFIRGACWVQEGGGHIGEEACK
jgi:hypothetical protein